MEQPIENTYEDTIYPCSIHSDGTWTTSRDDRISLIDQQFGTPPGVEWESEPVRFISPARDSIDRCPECEAGVPADAPMLEAVAHQIYPCCSCSVFAWLERPAVPSNFVEDNL